MGQLTSFNFAFNFEVKIDIISDIDTSKLLNIIAYAKKNEIEHAITSRIPNKTYPSYMNWIIDAPPLIKYVASPKIPIPSML